MIELTDWESLELQNPGTPPWWVLAIRLSGQTPTSHRTVFVAIEHAPKSEPTRVLITVEYAEAETDVLTPWTVDVRIARKGISEYRIVGKTMEHQVTTAVEPD